ncbi:MAG: radical SAM/SPASM domain-containing protein [Candidatus Heimdallarchaeaceae archaeon]
MSDFPDVLQIEPTNACNYSCKMCLSTIRNRDSPVFFSLEEFQKLAEEVFPNLKKLVLYGLGEPLMHPNFLILLEIARIHLPSSAKVTFTTNGSLLDSEKIDHILENELADEIIFSCESIEDSGNQIGHLLDELSVQNNLDYCLQHELRDTINIGIETVIMESNYKELEEVVEKFSNKKVNFIALSHLYPFNETFEKETIFSMITTEALGILDEVGSKWKEIVLGVSREKFAEQMQESYKAYYKNKDILKPKQRPISEKYQSYVKRAKEENVTLNISLYQKEEPKRSKLEELRKIFTKCKLIAGRKGVELILPSIFPTFEDRNCPYTIQKGCVIRSDGEVVPCFKYLWEHDSFLNSHSRYSSFFSYGNIANKPFLEIWNSKNYASFREKKNKINENFPYCGNCSFSSNNCFYVTEDTSDCWGNEPFCSECPYSVNLTKCLL